MPMVFTTWFVLESFISSRNDEEEMRRLKADGMTAMEAAGGWDDGIGGGWRVG